MPLHALAGTTQGQHGVGCGVLLAHEAVDLAFCQRDDLGYWQRCHGRRAGRDGLNVDQLVREAGARLPATGEPDVVVARLDEPFGRADAEG